MANAYRSTSGPGHGGPALLACSACTHLWAEHDEIAARYCAATMVGHHQRGCICDVPAGAGAGTTD